MIKRERTSIPSIRVGGASGFWGESDMGAPQLLAAGDIDDLIFDHLAEIKTCARVLLRTPIAIPASLLTEGR